MRVQLLQGWQADPFHRYDQRYFSNGAPTALVRSDGVEARDAPEARADELVVVEADDDPIEVERPLRPMIYVVQSHPWRARCIVAVFAAITLAGFLWLTPFPTFTIELLAIVVVALAVLTGPRWMRRVS